MNFLTANWEKLVMANYAIEPHILEPFVPKGCALDFYGDKTYVSLVGFLFSRTRVFGITVPGMSTFEEVNLRFYVRREVNGEVRRGVVFIKEIVPSKLIAGTANLLYQENYIALPTRHSWSENGKLEVGYFWKTGKDWNHLKATANNQKSALIPGSHQEFILEHYYGYTGTADKGTEYKVEHPRWDIYSVESFDIRCDFGKLYGETFDCLKDQPPDSVYLAEGSPIAVKWKRKQL